MTGKEKVLFLLPLAYFHLSRSPLSPCCCGLLNKSPIPYLSPCFLSACFLLQKKEIDSSITWLLPGLLPCLPIFTFLLLLFGFSLFLYFSLYLSGNYSKKIPFA